VILLEFLSHPEVPHMWVAGSHVLLQICTMDEWSLFIIIIVVNIIIIIRPTSVILLEFLSHPEVWVGPCRVAPGSYLSWTSGGGRKRSWVGVINLKIIIIFILTSIIIIIIILPCLSISWPHRWVEYGYCGPCCLPLLRLRPHARGAGGGEGAVHPGDGGAGGFGGGLR
jgi:hypothetical protein